MKRIFLIGYMGAGKTTLGRPLSRAMNLEFIDLDNFIEARYHKTVKDIFAEVGEEGFRKIEHRSLEEVADYENVVIALGGGTPCFMDNMDIVNRAGVSVYLKPNEEVLLRRLIIGKQKRPLLANKSDEEILTFIREQLAWREPFYLRANIIFESSHLENRKDIASNAEKISQIIEQM
ncbi:MAG: shikimate kinase [Bacteroidales bacterium]|nr:shikimate kinase [Bacteroidales bacterium]